MDYYNKEKYQWDLIKLSPDEFYEFYITGEYPLKIEHPPPVPIPEKPIGNLGKTKPLKERGGMPQNKLQHGFPASRWATFKRNYTIRTMDNPTFMYLPFRVCKVYVPNE